MADAEFPLMSDDITDEADFVAENREITFPASLHGQRIDKALSEMLPEFSRSYVQQMLMQGCVSSLADGHGIEKPSLKVSAGQQIRLELRPTPQSQAFTPQEMAIDTVYSDDDLRVINKPAGLVVHPAPGHWAGTLLNGLLALDAQAMVLPRAGIVHRLDKDTSGLMMLARNRECMDKLVQMIASRAVKREYLAMVNGPWKKPQTITIRQPIGRDPKNRLRMAVVDLLKHSGKSAATHIRVLQAGSDAVLLHCELETGRTHQIRVHLADAGYPLIGDLLYGGKPVGGFQRQALHAYRLSLVHPVTGQNLVFEAQPPDDMKLLMKKLSLSYN
jgi:23S rRNA pseudouridine1911/1915/1917 synthase